jgi:hypothetical protein
MCPRRLLTNRHPAIQSGFEPRGLSMGCFSGLLRCSFADYLRGGGRRSIPLAISTGSCMSAIVGIVLQKSKVASARIFGETLKRETIDDSDSLSRAIEVADEFSVKG